MVRRQSMVFWTTAVWTLVATLALAGCRCSDTRPEADRKRLPRASQDWLFAVRSTLGDLTIERIRREVSADDGSRRRMVALLLQAGLGDAALLHELLHRKTRVSPAAYKGVLRLIGASVPNSAGRFSREESNPDLDWLKALLDLDPARLGKGQREAHCEAVISSALIQALAGTRHHDGAVSLVRFAYRHQGAFRDHCGRQIRTMGNYAVPGLLRVRVLKDPLAFKMVRYASYQLDRLDCTRPDRAMKHTDPDLQAEILHAFGEVRDPAAVSTVLRFTNAASQKVRRAARWAMLRYVSGRQPRAVKRRLTLSGGRTTERARSLFMTYWELASHALAGYLAREAAGAHVEEQDLDRAKSTLIAEVEPRQMAERLFSRYDRLREQALQAQMDRAVALGSKGDLAQAVKELDGILSGAPHHPRRQEMAQLYYRRGLQLLQARRPQQALRLLTKSVHLSPTAAFVAKARASRLYLEALLQDPQEVGREWKLHRALTLLPDLEPARMELHRLERTRQQRLFIAGGVGGGLALCLVLGLSLAWRRLLPSR